MEEVRERVQKWGEDGLLLVFPDPALASCCNTMPSCTTLVIVDQLHPDYGSARAMQDLGRIRSFFPNLVHLCLIEWPRGSYIYTGRSLIWLLTAAASASCTSSLDSLSLICPAFARVSLEALQKLDTLLARNPSLTSLTLSGLLFPPATIPHLFTSLTQRSHRLSFLSLSDSHAGGHPAADLQEHWPIASTLDFLRVHTTVCEVDLTSTPLQNHPAITAQLLRNKVAAEQCFDSSPERGLQVECSLDEEPIPSDSRPMPVDSRSVWHPTVRVFLCGLPRSGKTTLARSLANWNNNASWLSRATSRRRPGRTRGIDVTTLEKEVGHHHQRIHLWDMAGQMEFHSFHDSMFPDLSSSATTSMFLFVWNPFQLDSKGNIKIDPQGQASRKGEHEFRHDFKYWLSFIASKTLKSECFKLKVLVAITRADLPGSEHVKAWLMRPFTALQEEFQELVQFDEEGFFLLNAKDHVQAGRLGSHVFHCAAQDIVGRVPAIDRRCAQARKLLGKMLHENRIPPLITKHKFHQLCMRSEELQMDSQETREAVAISLNDSGDLFYFQFLELVVLDTRWFCHKIMGDLLDYIITKESFNDVFFPVSELEARLERIMNLRAPWGRLINKRAHKKVEGCDLVKLLVGLQLACQNKSRIFLSIGLSSKARRTLFPCKFLASDGKSDSTHTYLGRRFTCKNFKCTFLTPGIFPLLQVTFHNKLHDREAPIDVLLEQDVMAFAFGGIKVFIEFCRLEGKDHFIDILIYSRKSLDATIEWVQENVIKEVTDVCAQPRGVQGVELAQAIIQRASIEKFSEARDRPAVSVKELQDELKKHVERKGVTLTEYDDDGIKSVMHTWQVTPFPTDSVVDLLGEVETARVVRSYLWGLSDAQIEISNLFAEEAETSHAQKPRQFGSSQSSKEREILYDKLCELEMNVMRDLAKLGHAVQDLRKAVLPKLCNLFTFVQEGEVGKLPRMFVVTEDNRIVQRVVSAMVRGLQSLQLKLLCECRGEPCHLVDGKGGLSLATLDDGLLNRGLPYITALLKMAYVVARVGAHVAVGFGDVIPDFTQVLAGIVDAPVLDDWNVSRVDFKQGRQWLFDVLSDSNCITGKEIYAVFGLRRVRFPDYRAAWVCDKHYREGTPWPA